MPASTRPRPRAYDGDSEILICPDCLWVGITRGITWFICPECRQLAVRPAYADEVAGSCFAILPPTETPDQAPGE